MIFVILWIVLIGLIIFFVKKHYQTYQAMKHVPGPRILPFVGNALELGSKEEYLANIHRLTKTYGGLFRLCIGPQNGVLISDPKYVSQVFAVTDSHHKGDLYLITKPLLGEGLISSSGEKWARQRRILNPAFSNRKLEMYVSAFNSAANKLVEQLKKQVGLEYVDITDPIFCCTLNSICKAAMKIDITENKKYHSDIYKLLGLIFTRFTSPLKKIDFLYSFTNDYLETKRYAKSIDDFVLDVIRKRKKEFSLVNADQSSILDEMFRLTGDDILTQQEMLDQVKTFVFAGSDTIGATLSLGIYELAKHPDIQEKILQEVAGVKVDTDIDDIRELKYTECVLKEMLRKYTPVPFVTRILQNKIKLGDVAIPEATTAILFMHGVHMSEEVYPDPERFDPDRFLPENCKERDACSFVPFASGVRVCIGQKFGMLEGKVILAKIIQNFELIAHPEHKAKLIAAGILKSDNGLPVKLKLRKRSA